MLCMSVNITINCEVFLGSKLYSTWMLSMISYSIGPTKTHNNYLALLKLNHLWFCLLAMFIFALKILRFYQMLHTSFFLRSSSFLFFSSLICAKRCFFLSSSAFRSLLSDMMPQLYTENIVCPCVPLNYTNKGCIFEYGNNSHTTRVSWCSSGLPVLVPSTHK